MKPAVERLKSAVERLKSAVECLKPSVERLKPSVERLKSAVERLKRAVEISKSINDGLMLFQFVYKWVDFLGLRLLNFFNWLIFWAPQSPAQGLFLLA